MAQGWGFVVAAYSLLEQSFKALLYMRGKQVPVKHSLSDLFDQFETKDRGVLREYYSDYKATAEGMGSFPFETLDDLLRNRPTRWAQLPCTRSVAISDRRAKCARRTLKLRGDPGSPDLWPVTVR